MSAAVSSVIEFDVRGYDCGYGGSLGALAIANFLQEAAGASAAVLGFGMEAMDARGWTWMLSRLDIRIDELPREGERVSVMTWPSELRKLFALRDFVMRGSDDRSLVRAVYAYLVVDMTARKPSGPRAYSVTIRLSRRSRTRCPTSPSTSQPPSIPSFRSSNASAAVISTITGTRTTRTSSIGWLMPKLQRTPRCGEGRRRGKLSALRVEFLAEALEGDELVASRVCSGSPFGPARRPHRPSSSFRAALRR